MLSMLETRRHVERDRVERDRVEGQQSSRLPGESGCFISSEPERLEEEEGDERESSSERSICW